MVFILAFDGIRCVILVSIGWDSLWVEGIALLDLTNRGFDGSMFPLTLEGMHSLAGEGLLFKLLSLSQTTAD
jgi:hypothetical protein